VRPNVLGILLHTDASVIGQGLVAETVQLSGLAGFSTAGTDPIIVNNQIGLQQPYERRGEARSASRDTPVRL